MKDVTVIQTELAQNSVCHYNNNNALSMTHSTANSTHYGNVLAPYINWHQCSAFGIATCYWLDGPVVEFR